MAERSILEFVVEGVFGYWLQYFLFVLGMHAVARQRIQWGRMAFVSALCGGIVWLLREIPMLQFGVHTMLSCLVTDVLCVIICKMDIRKAVLGSIIMIILIMLTDLFNYAFLMLFMDMEHIQTFLSDVIYKTVSALPGNAVLLIALLITYRIRMRKAVAA